MADHGQRGYVEQIRGGQVIGWAIDPRQPRGPVGLFLFIDDQLAANFVCDIARPDVTDGQTSDMRPGFAVTIPAQWFDDTPHRICVRFAGGEYLPITDDTGRTAPVALMTLRPLLTLVSHVDGLTAGTLRGWAFLRDPHGSQTAFRTGLDIVVQCGGVTLGTVKADKNRPDVAQATGCDAHCGFKFMPPPRYRDGRTYRFDFSLASTGEALDNSPAVYESAPHLPQTQLARLFVAVDTMSTQLFQLKRELAGMLASTAITLDDYDGWARQYQVALRARRQRAVWPEGVARPLVSVLCPVYRPQLTDFRAAVDSVLAQSWTALELILVDDQSGQPALTAVLEAYAAQDKRVRLIVLPKNGGISAATNAAIAAARGEYTAFFDHDDLLLDVALEVMMEAAVRSGAKMLYSDEDKIDAQGRFSEPNLKSAWNHRLLLGQNYVCHFLVVHTATLRQAGPLHKKYDGAQDHDLVLRLSEIIPPQEIVHVPEVIYHWRKTAGSTAVAISAKSYAVKAGAAAVRDHLKRRGHAGRVSPMLGVTTYEVAWGFKAEPRVTVVIPFKEQAAMTARCLAALLSVTDYAAFDVVLVDNWSSSDEAAAFCREAARDRRVRVLRVEEAFNYSRLNNLACAGSDAAFFVFMNNDVLVEQPDWLRRMVDEALADPAVSAVGAKLVYPDRSVQHAGVILGVDGVGDHANRGRPVNDPHYVGRGICAQELSAVTAALMLCRAEAFRAVGGFDEQDLAVAYNDVDLCLKLRRAGGKVVYCPAVIAEHHESASRGDDMQGERLSRFVYEQEALLSRWRAEIAADPFYNPNFSTQGGIFLELSAEALRAEALPPLRYRRDEWAGRLP